MPSLSFISERIDNAISSCVLFMRKYLFYIEHNGQRYTQYGVSKLIPYQYAEKLKRATNAELRCSPRIAYDRMLPPGISVFYVYNKLFRHNFILILNLMIAIGLNAIFFKNLMTLT